MKKIDISIKDIIIEMIRYRIAPHYEDSIEKEKIYTYKYFVDFTYTIIDKYRLGMEIDLDDYDKPEKRYYTKVRSIWDEDLDGTYDAFADENVSYQEMKAWDDETRKEAYFIFNKEVRKFIVDYQIKYSKSNETNIFDIPLEERGQESDLFLKKTFKREID